MSEATTERCHCGQPLHYADPWARAYVESLIAHLGPNIPVTVEGRTWAVPRHYIALHGLMGAEVAHLGFREIEGGRD